MLASETVSAKESEKEMKAHLCLSECPIAIRRCLGTSWYQGLGIAVIGMTVPFFLKECGL